MHEVHVEPNSFTNEPSLITPAGGWILLPPCGLRARAEGLAQKPE